MCLAAHGTQSRRYGAGRRRLSSVDTSPLTVGPATMSRISCAMRARPSSVLIPAAFSGLLASNTRLPASASLNGAVAAATPAMSARR